ncbi:MAG: HAD hydrolase-like protein [Candidatus Omnitrophica bacterium]|nr:HAD hydrolase-like protein [Candidatus Omnitrophota bacterium]
MIKSIIFDFDGVILESAGIKTEAFKEIFADVFIGQPEKLQRVMDYHIRNAGISRFVKFRYAYEQLLHEQLSKDKETELGEKFARVVYDKVIAAPFVPGARKFLERNRDSYLFFIASGTPEQELSRIIKARHLGSFFKEVHGSPKEKKDIITDVMERHGFSRDEVAYVGDAESDRLAAESSRVIFIERSPGSKAVFSSGENIIGDLADLDSAIEYINRSISKTHI